LKFDVCDVVFPNADVAQPGHGQHGQCGSGLDGALPTGLPASAQDSDACASLAKVRWSDSIFTQLVQQQIEFATSR
jgi:hypothetical protein